MNLLHRSIFSQQQRRQSKQVICPACGLPAVFTFYGYQRDDQGGRVEQWLCGHCETVMALSEPWPIAPVPRVSLKDSMPSLPLPIFAQDDQRFDLAEMT